MMKDRLSSFSERKGSPTKESFKTVTRSCTSKWSSKTLEKSYKESARSYLSSIMIIPKIQIDLKNFRKSMFFNFNFCY